MPKRVIQDQDGGRGEELQRPTFQGDLNNGLAEEIAVRRVVQGDADWSKKLHYYAQYCVHKNPGKMHQESRRRVKQ